MAIQSLHVINGDEYEKIVGQVEKYRPFFRYLRVGKPLLSSFEDYSQLIDALHFQMPELKADERVVFMVTAPLTTPSPLMPVRIT